MEVARAGLLVFYEILYTFSEISKINKNFWKKRIYKILRKRVILILDKYIFFIPHQPISHYWKRFYVNTGSNFPVFQFCPLNISNSSFSWDLFYHYSIWYKMVLNSNQVVLQNLWRQKSTGYVLKGKFPFLHSVNKEISCFTAKNMLEYGCISCQYIHVYRLNAEYNDQQRRIRKLVKNLRWCVLQI